MSTRVSTINDKVWISCSRPALPRGGLITLQRVEQNNLIGSCDRPPATSALFYSNALSAAVVPKVDCARELVCARH